MQAQLATMSQNVYQFIDLQRVDPPKKPLKIRAKLSLLKFTSRFRRPRPKRRLTFACRAATHTASEMPGTQLHPELAEARQRGAIFFEAAELYRTRPIPCRKCADVSARKTVCAEGSCTLNDEFGAVTIGNIERIINDKAVPKWAGVDLSGVKQTGKKWRLSALAWRSGVRGCPDAQRRKSGRLRPSRKLADC